MVDKMREEFLVWYNQQEQFGDAHQEELWKSWKASREALTINLPTCRNVQQSEYKYELIDELYDHGINYY